MIFLHDRLPIAKIINATVITLDNAPQGYKDFNREPRGSSLSIPTTQSMERPDLPVDESTIVDECSKL